MELELKAQTRENVGKKLESLRKQGIVPAIVYGSNHKPISIQVNYEEFRKVFEKAGESTLLKLKIQNLNDKKEETKNVLIHDVAKNPISREFIHIDFYQVRMDKEIKAEVPFLFEGEAPAVKILEGVLIKAMNHIEIEALAKDLPREIKVDISVLDTLDKNIRIKDLILPKGVKTNINPEEVIVSIVPPRTEEEIKTTEELPTETIGPETTEQSVVGSEGKQTSSSNPENAGGGDKPKT
ncbi:MAG TPA: 50S ribosomal protein L25, partial [Candidatus Portnoybacteria bacterium]|jgi:large subunit ribosomal protein L25|nr:50S ribosomal protein L25 [Candidatus Portnoybacteria bacterium]MDD5752110.1 50S ribosomal protein L25 [Candidatus Portnoybacteria bacterium]HOZ16603.1 50S ribosomal protein L25 [Candidatus Portnoybacteria bacterium]HPH52379.1 50S ribosomal protein L25 [Candidatus Portnoybacteria bacterium]HPJ80334.1 50S ribosomal protein L25 [Candidatus Portnoybacteria bacterium]